MMDVKIRAIALLLSMFEMLVLVQTLEDDRVEIKNFFKEACDSMMVSHAGTTEGKTIFVQHSF